MTTSSATFRYAGAPELETVRGLVERAFRGEEAAKGWSNEAALLAGARTSQAEIAALAADPDCRFVLAEIDSLPVGCALIRRLDDGRGYCGMFAIEPTLQSAGLGTALLNRLEVAVVELWGAPALSLVVIDLRSELIAWYERRGYRLTGEREPFPFSETTGELQSDFELVEMEKTL